MLDRETIEYFSLSGARVLLDPYEDRGIPDDPKQWKRVLATGIRMLWNSEQEGGRTLYEVAAQLRTAADLYEAHPPGPPHFLEDIPRAVPPERTPSVLREIAYHVEEWKSLPRQQRFADVVPHTWELFYRFPRLKHLGRVYFGQDGIALEGEMEDADEDEGVRMYIDRVHPECLWQLPGLVAECHEALAIFHTEESLERFFELEHGMGCGAMEWREFLLMVAHEATQHMREQHPPAWHGVRGSELRRDPQA